MNLSVSKLQRTRDEELAPHCQNIHDKGTANLAALADFGITAAILANPDFVQTYESNRIIVDPPTKPKKLKVTAKKLDDKPV